MKKLPPEGIQIAPGVWIPDLIADLECSISRTGIAQWVEAERGAWKPQVRLIEWGWSVGAFEKKGLSLDPLTLRRLAAGGYFKICRPAPKSLLIDPQSFIAHLKKAVDPAFWTMARCRAYSRIKEPIS